jgi:hypothetical protein
VDRTYQVAVAPPTARQLQPHQQRSRRSSSRHVAQGETRRLRPARCGGLQVRCSRAGAATGRVSGLGLGRRRTGCGQAARCQSPARGRAGRRAAHARVGLRAPCSMTSPRGTSRLTQARVSPTRGFPPRPRRRHPPRPACAHLSEKRKHFCEAVKIVRIPFQRRHVRQLHYDLICACIRVAFQAVCNCERPAGQIAEVGF